MVAAFFPKSNENLWRYITYIELYNKKQRFYMRDFIHFIIWSCSLNICVNGVLLFSTVKTDRIRILLFHQKNCFPYCCRNKERKFLVDCSPFASLDVSLMLNPFTLRGTLESVVCYSYTFENNMGIKRNFNKYLKESCCLASNQHFSFKCFFRKCFCKLNIFKIVRPILAALSVNGLRKDSKYRPLKCFLSALCTCHIRGQLSGG